MSKKTKKNLMEQPRAEISEDTTTPVQKPGAPKQPIGPQAPTRRKKPDFFQQFMWILLLVTLVSWGITSLREHDDVEPLTLSEVAAEIQTGQVEEIIVRGDNLEVYLVNAENSEEPLERSAKKEREASLTETLVNYGVTAEQLAAVPIEVKNENGFGYWVGRVLPTLVPILFLAILIWFLFGQVRGAGMRAFSFGQSKARMVHPKDLKVNFDKVAGNIEAKQELQEVVEFLKNPKKFFAIGAKIPKGLLLMGAPGTGKTLLARAVAGEAGVPFFHLSGSEFVEMFVGVGASRVRDLFAMAKKAAPAIIFIDEIDAVGRSRGVGIGGGNDEREQTLNQILVEMDGFDPNEKVIVVAATNRMDVLDPALLRPGRFDRRVTLDLPDRKDRQAILEIHADKKPLADDVNLTVVAQRTPGFSGADLESLMNEAAILAARQDKKKIHQNDILNSIDKVLIGPERRSHLHTKEERNITAYHEAGHAVVASAIPGSDPVRKVSIVARGHAGGYTLKLSEEDRKLRSRQDYINDIAMTLGGYAAEQLVFGDVTTGPSNDLQVATKTARNMVTRWGMSSVIGPIALEGNNGQTLFGAGGVDKDQHSERVEGVIDEEVSKIMQAGLVTAKESLTKYRSALDAVAQKLLQVETLEQDEYEAVIRDHGMLVALSNNGVA